MSVVTETFEAFRKAQNKPFLNDSAGIAWQATLGAGQDDSMERVVEAGNSRFPDDVATDGLQYIGSERQLERGFNETEASYRSVLRNAWSVWAEGGSQQSHIDWMARLGFGKVFVRRRREFSGLTPSGVPYIDTFTKDVWAQFDLIAQKPMPWRARYWGTGTWGTGVWGISATSAEVAQVIRLARQFRAGHDTPMWLHLHFGSGSIWGIGVWGSGVWGGSGPVIRLLIGEPHWKNRGLIP